MLHRRKIGALPLPDRPGLDPATRAAALEFVGRFVTGYRDLRWHEFYTRVGERPSAHYIPEDIFYALVLPALNGSGGAHILRDKNHFDLLPGWPGRPTTIGRLMNGRLLGTDFSPVALGDIEALARGHDEIAVKPSRQSGSGKNIQFCPPGDLARALVGRRDAVIQLAIAQHPALAALHPASTNSVRAVTYRKLDGELVFVSGTLRIGRNLMRIDNRVAGGVACAIRDDGRLDRFAYDAACARYEKHPDTGIVFDGYPMPEFDALRAAVLTAHDHAPWLDMASWDVTVDSNSQVTIIEVNVGTTMSLPQTVNGPVFAPVADDMMQRIGSHRYSALMGFL